MTVGFLMAVVVAMAFRLIPTIEATPLRWPGLRRVAAVALLGAVVVRTAEVLVAYGVPWLAPLVPLSGRLAWLAVAAVAANPAGVMVARGRGGRVG